jgi:opacity protein-like surface antigen
MLMSFSKITLVGATFLVYSNLAVAADMPSREMARAPVFAQPAVSGFYFGTRNGVTVADDTRFGIAGGAVSVKNEYEVGNSNALVLGYNFGPVLGGVGMRSELEFGRSQLSVDTHTVNGVKINDTDSFGELRTYAGFVNAYFDFNLGRMTNASSDSFLNKLTPFVGAGAGYAQVELRKMGISASGVILKDTDEQFAYQLSAGLGFSLFERTTAEIGYRYMSVPDLKFVARDGTSTKTDLNANILTIGMRRQF